MLIRNMRLGGFATAEEREGSMLHWIWVIIIGFIAGLIARALSPAPNNPQGFILTSLLGIIGALVATYLGQALHIYNEGQNAGLIGAIIGAVIVLFIWRLVFGRGYNI
jgi:uncharacterized membrane protein YeaQ/YmgE (transglycosylase-associated protein family)